jgi:amino acid transporter
MRERKAIGLFSAISIGIGAMIGAGIFSILGIATAISGRAMYLSFILAGLIALLSTYSYAKLGARYPSAGGPVEFLTKGLGDNVISGGFNILLWVGYIFALALYARAFAGYAITFLPADSPGFSQNIIASSIILIFTVINFIGTKAVGKSELVIVSVKVGILSLFVITGIFFVKPENLSLNYISNTSQIFFGAGIVFLAYQGFGLITNTAEDMKNPKKTLPKALYLSVMIVMIIYFLVAITALGNLPVQQIINAKEYALAAAARPFLGMMGFTLIGIAALFSTASGINATLYGGANVSYMIAKEGELPKIFERRIWKNSSEGLFITVALVLIFVNMFQLDSIATLGSASLLIIYIAVNIGHFKIIKETQANRLIIILSIITCILFLGILIYYETSHSPTTLVALVTVFIGSFIAEFFYRNRTKREIKTRT